MIDRLSLSVLKQLVSGLPVHQYFVTCLSGVNCHEIGRILATDSR